DQSPPMTVFHDNTLKNPNDLNHKGWTTMYIPARLADNKYIDPSYSAVFSAMSPARAKALRDGDWDAVEGSALHLLDKDRHCLAPFTSPRHWATYMALDWGTASPFAVLWFAVASEDSKAHLYNGKPVLVPRGTLIQTNEWYGWTGKENEGVRLPSNVVARRILEKEEALNIRRPEVRIADSSMWNRVDAASPAENMMEATSGRLMLTRCRKDRQSNFDEVNCRLAGNPRLNHDGRIEDTPMLYITANCVQTWRTLPSLLLDSQHPEMGPDGRGENHCYDSLSYMCASRPYAVTLKDRQLAEYNEIKRQRQVNMDHYATRQ
ncbi:MAG: hypothetical protein ACREXR_00610, partial [Gammaproteobacteria bacterium]